MTETVAPVLGEATLEELRQAARGEVLMPRTNATRRQAGSGTACTTGGDPR